MKQQKTNFGVNLVEYFLHSSFPFVRLKPIAATVTCSRLQINPFLLNYSLHSFKSHCDKGEESIQSGWVGS